MDMRKLFMLLASAILFSILFSATSTNGQQKKLDAVAERKCYDLLNACIAEKDPCRKVEIAKEALENYPQTQYAPYFTAQIKSANCPSNPEYDSNYANAIGDRSHRDNSSPNRSPIDNNSTKLLNAAEKGDAAAVKELLQSSNVNFRD